MKILVTGANGYLGMGIVNQLLNENQIIVATDYQVDNIDQRAIIKKTDIFKVENPYEYFEKPDVLLHLAWRNGFIHNAISHIEEMPNHYSFIKKLVESGIKQVTCLGSMHEIGFYEGCIDENTPTNPLSLYGIGKDALRKSVELLAKEKGTTFQWLRGYYIVGNTGYGNSIFSKINIAEKEGQEEFPFTTGQNQWDFLNYDDFCKQVAATVEQDEINGVVNICSGYPEKLADRVERFIQENNYKIRLKYGAFPDRAYDSKAVWGDNRKIKSIMENRQKGKL
ncbi:NAD-dependent epimerase/dehydratase family protein [Eubacterium maltosivorans]|uniref:NAD(P)-dependent oxidoreductase n=1 Tax=Eubacterium maltosivorans TaxID=2041044 RepID=A0A4P9C5N0_EUBML|nr:NAD(P)-dependent oxidoreductase [Eubacterium maltosivorans]QCT70594.1 NAD(P)-dependent oxidoreductase [Eubacterium maltosivorans]